MIIKSKKDLKSMIGYAIGEHLFGSIAFFLILFTGPLFFGNRYGKHGLAEFWIKQMQQSPYKFVLILFSVVIFFNLIYYGIKGKKSFISILKFDDTERLITIGYKFKYSKKRLIKEIKYDDLEFKLYERKVTPKIKLFDKLHYRGKISVTDYLWSNDLRAIRKIYSKLKEIKGN